MGSHAVSTKEPSPSAKQQDKWPSAQQLACIAETSRALAETLRRYSRSFSRQGAPWINEIHTAMERLDYLFHGRSLENYERDQKRWWPSSLYCSLARWIVATPGENECLTSEFFLDRPMFTTGPDIVGWNREVKCPYNAIFHGLSVLKCFFDHEPVFAINKWSRPRQPLLQNIRRRIPYLESGALEELVPELLCRRVIWGAPLNGTDAPKYPPEIQELGRLEKSSARTAPIPESWIDSLFQFSAELRETIERHGGRNGSPMGETEKGDKPTPADYGDNYERDQWLTEKYSEMQKPRLEKELERIARERDWTPIGREGIDDAVDRYCLTFGVLKPKAPRGRPKKSGK